VSIRTKIAKSITATVAGVIAASALTVAPTVAQAQGAYDNDGYYYDPCKRDKTNRATMGGVLGALAGAAIGSNVAAGGVRTEGALLGGAVGAVGGAMIGNRTAACESGYAPSAPPPRTSYYREGPAYYSSDRRYDNYDRSRYYDDRPGYTESYTSVVERPAASADDCTLAESPIYMPDGRTQKRFVRVCRDSSGRYQTVE
jgi:hypothetical protein